MSTSLTNRSIPINYVFGFYSAPNTFSKKSLLSSVLAILPIIGAPAALVGALHRSVCEVILPRSGLTTQTRTTILTICILRAILSCLGAGIVFFLLDIIYTSGVWIASKCCKPKTENTFELRPVV